MKTLKKLLYCILMFGLLLAIRSTAAAQTLEKKSLTLDGAERVIAAAKAEASKVKAPGGVIAVVDSGGNLMALERLDATFAAGENISMISVLRLAWTIMSPSLLIPMNYSLHYYVGSSRAIEPAQRLRVQSQYRVCRAVRTPESDALEIAGIDTESALRRTGGNRKRCEALLRKFVEPSAGGVEEIRSALAAGDTLTAARAAHLLKGAAANLGATFHTCFVFQNPINQDLI